MEAKPTFICLTVLCLLWTPMTVKPHHATAIQFDVSKTIQVKGVISKLDWANPHVHLSLDIKTSGAADEQWNVELASPGGIIVTGLSKDALKPGTTVRITGYPAKTNGSRNPSMLLSVCATQLTLADGTTATFVVGI